MKTNEQRILDVQSMSPLGRKILMFKHGRQCCVEGSEGITVNAYEYDGAYYNADSIECERLSADYIEKPTIPAWEKTLFIAVVAFGIAILAFMNARF